MDEQIKQLEKHFEQFEGRFDSHLEVYRNNGKETAGVKVEVKELRADIKEIKELLGNKYVTMKEFIPVRLVVYGLVGLMLAGVIGAIVSSVLVNNNSAKLDAQIANGVNKALSAYEVEIK